MIGLTVLTASVYIRLGNCAGRARQSVRGGERVIARYRVDAQPGRTRRTRVPVQGHLVCPPSDRCEGQRWRDRVSAGDSRETRQPTTGIDRERVPVGSPIKIAVDPHLRVERRGPPIPNRRAAALPECEGSPAFDVAAAEFPATKTYAPLKTSAFAKSSWRGAAYAGLDAVTAAAMTGSVASRLQK